MKARKQDNALQVLIIDSDKAMSEALREAIRPRVHEPSVAWGFADALDRGAAVKPDVIYMRSPLSSHEKALLSELRARHAGTPIIGYSDKDEDRNSLLRLGAVDLAVTASDLRSPLAITILDDAVRLRNARDRDELDWARQAPLRHSKTFGSMVATVTGVVQHANACIAKWLGYPDADYLVGVNFALRHLKRPSDWETLSNAASSLDSVVQVELAARDVDGRWIALNLEASAVTDCQGLVRLLILDETEKELLKATFELNFEKASSGQIAVQ